MPEREYAEFLMVYTLGLGSCCTGQRAQRSISARRRPQPLISTQFGPSQSCSGFSHVGDTAVALMGAAVCVVTHTLLRNFSRPKSLMMLGHHCGKRFGAPRQIVQPWHLRSPLSQSASSTVHRGAMADTLAVFWAASGSRPSSRSLSFSFLSL